MRLSNVMREAECVPLAFVASAALADLRESIEGVIQCDNR